MHFDKLRVLFTPAYGSRIRNAVRVALPALVALGVIDLTAEQIANLVILTEVVFTAGGEVTKRY